MGTNLPKQMADSYKSAPVLSKHALNRALLARQLLLDRVHLPVIEVLERLIGLQAQAPQAPYFALWTRIEGFRQEELSRLLLSRKAVRLSLMRSTLHLVSARDCLRLRPWVQTVQERSLQGAYGKKLTGADLAELAATGRVLVEAAPLTFHELGERLRERWPDYEAGALSAAIRSLVPLIQLPPRGLWGESGQAVHTSAEAWLGQPLSVPPTAEAMILRYLAAFGPASVKDMQVWSGLTRLRDAVDQLQPQLVRFQDEDGNELFDLPDAPRPDANTPCPPRFLGEFDNILLSHADRRRILPEADYRRVFTVNGIIRSTFLVDGFVSGLWKIERKRGTALLTIEPFRPLSAQERSLLAEEGARLLAFAAEGDVPDIQFAVPL